MRPLILITNDDGVHLPGLRAAAEAVYELGDLLIAAPARQQTGMGRAFPRSAEQGIITEVNLNTVYGEITAYAVNGSPAYAVAHGVLELSGRKPDLCISGINYGENVGLTLTCSGTVGAVLEAQTYGIPGIAVSREIGLEHQRSSMYPEVNWATERQITRTWAKKVLAEGMPAGVDIWNINIPAEVSGRNDYRITRMARQNYFEFRRPEKRDRSFPFELQSQRKIYHERLEPDSDIHVLYIEKSVSVTPLSHDLTAAALLT